MIPPHKPSFGFGAILASATRNTQIQRLEEAYAEAAACSCAIWLPSARSGICWALRTAISDKTSVLAPAFVCGAVHEAVRRSGGSLRLIDASADGFLMNPQALVAPPSAGYAVVLCETYGHIYDIAELDRTIQPALRIFDMAMAVPHRNLFTRLGAHDFGVISFGIGKSMYAGWGAMGFTNNSSLAAEVKKMRDATLKQNNLGLAIRRAATISLRTLGHYPLIYSLAKRLRGRALPRSDREVAATPFPAHWADTRAFGPEWVLPSTRLDRNLARLNLLQSNVLGERRVELAGRYHQNLAAIKSVRLPAASQYALSHYTVRVDSASRELVRHKLYRSGINAITLWEFPSYLDRHEFPNAFRLSSEVLNLPLSSDLSLIDVDSICEALQGSLL